MTNTARYTFYVWIFWLIVALVLNWPLDRVTACGVMLILFWVTSGRRGE